MRLLLDLMLGSAIGISLAVLAISVIEQKPIAYVVNRVFGTRFK